MTDDKKIIKALLDRHIVSINKLVEKANNLDDENQNEKAAQVDKIMEAEINLFKVANEHFNKGEYDEVRKLLER